MTALDTIKQLQELLHESPDGSFGPRCQAAFRLLESLPPDSPWPPASTIAPDATGAHAVKASTFADPGDVRAFRECKARGESEMYCFGLGDNGVGKWGDDCSAGSGPAVALPPEQWAQFGSAARKKKIVLSANGRTVVCELRDTMPHEANITNGCRIDINPDACAALGVTPPDEFQATWSWHEELGL